MAACDINALLTANPCFLELSERAQLALIADLLCNISASAGSGGTQYAFQGTVDPVAPPTDPTKPAYYTNLTSGTIFTWNVTSQAWV